jgi:hypothetical protein
VSEHSKPYKFIQRLLKLVLIPIRLPWRLVRRLFLLFVTEKDMTKAFWDSFKNAFVVGLLFIIFIQSFSQNLGIAVQAISAIALTLALIAHFAQLYGHFFKPFIVGGFRVVFREAVFNASEWEKFFGRGPGDNIPKNIRLHDDAYVKLKVSTFFMYLVLLVLPYAIQSASVIVIVLSALDYSQKIR